MKRLLQSHLFIAILFLLVRCDGDGGTEPKPDPTPSNTRTATVTHVYDGDTIQVNGNEKVRYIGIDTPEIGECYYTEASRRNRELVDDRVVTLDVCIESPTDQYGRTLAHVTADAGLVNAILIREGFARAYRVPPCTSKADQYADLDREARAANRGMWDECY